MSNRRFTIAFQFFIVLFLLIIGRLFYWQVVRADELAIMGESQYGKNIKLIPIRGEIKTADNYAIAANKLSYLVFANPKEIENIHTTSELLSKPLEMEAASISALLELNRYWVALKPQINVDAKDAIEKLNIKGVGFEEHSVRYYPEASTAAKLLGFVGKDESGDNKGYFGLEGFYDRQLKGKQGRAHQIHDALGQPILAKMNKDSGEIDGRNLILNIDRAIQFVLDTELQKGIDRYGAAGGMAAIMDPKTGKMIAMSAFPSFDPRDYGKYTSDAYRNQLISDTYEPGSTFKPLIMSAAIDSGVVEDDTRCTICSSPVEIAGYKIKTWNDKYYPNTTMAEAIVHSDNTGMVFAAQKMGLDRMLSYFKRFGIGQLTGIDLQGETIPIIRAKSDWGDIDLATASFGQGISITAIELLSAFSAIANDGVRMKPQIVGKIETPGGEIREIPTSELSRPISKKTARVMTEILVQTVNDGEAKWATPKGYRIAGKTGTAQIPIGGRYDAIKTIPSFIGFAPADDPKFIMLVVLDRPSSSIYGSETAAPIFFTMARYMLDYYGIPPTESLEDAKTE